MVSSLAKYRAGLQRARFAILGNLVCSLLFSVNYVLTWSIGEVLQMICYGLASAILLLATYYELCAAVIRNETDKLCDEINEIRNSTVELGASRW